eukprot:GHUV01044968.1.p1 GENE.GHUV01044968.1~~GHUV01044968.1.p1  ORF type:complete len:164 (-),score=71.67 GHUV01044968.1:356-847(-)
MPTDEGYNNTFCIINPFHIVSCALQDIGLQQSLLQQAAEKLRASIQFSRADPAPHNALGDVLMDAAELAVIACNSSNSTSAAGGSSSVFGGSIPLAAEVTDQAAGLMKQAVDDGYMAALTINRTNADALVSILGHVLTYLRVTDAPELQAHGSVASAQGTGSL